MGQFVRPLLSQTVRRPITIQLVSPVITDITPRRMANVLKITITGMDKNST